MRILVVETHGIDAYNRMAEEYLREFSGKNTSIHARDDGSKRVDNCPSMIELVKKNEGKYDAIIVNCFWDPCVKAIRETVDIPVLGPGETSMLIASLLGHKFSVIATTSEGALKIGLQARELGIEERLASVIAVGIPWFELERDKEKTIEAIVEASEKAVENGAEAIVLGCTGMRRMAGEIRELLSVPLIEPLSLTLKIAEALVDLGLRHSKGSADEI